MGFANNFANEYLAVVSNPPSVVTVLDTAPSTPDPAGDERTLGDDGFEDLVCENSEEYVEGRFSCYNEEFEETEGTVHLH